MADTQAPGLYKYQMPPQAGETTGRTVLIGDPTLNKAQLQGAKFVGQENNPSATDPLITRYTAPADTSAPNSPLSSTPGTGASGEAAAAFASGGALGDRTPYTPDQQQAVRDAEAARVKSQVDAITQSSLLVRNAAIASGIDALGKARAANSSTGMIGSPTGDAVDSQVHTLNDQKLQAIEDKKNADIAAVLNGANDNAQKLIDARASAASSNEKSYLDYLSGVATNASSQLSTLAKAGTTYDELAAKDAVGLKNLLDQAGLSADAAKALMITNAPAGTYINASSPQISADGKTATFFKQTKDPKTGAVSITPESVALPGGIDPKNIDITSNKTGIYVISKVPNADGTFSSYRIGGTAEPTTASTGDTVLSIAQDLVNGLISPDQLSKRSSGVGSLNDIFTAAKKYSMDTYGKSFDFAEASRNYKYATNIQTQNTLNYLGSLIGGQGGTGNLDELKNLSDTITRTRFPALNDSAAWVRLAAGDPAIASYQATVTEVADQVAKILQGGGTGSGTSDAKLAQAAALFQTGFSKSQIDGVIGAIKPLLTNRAKSIIGNNPYLSSYADEFGFSQTLPDGSQSNQKTDEFKAAQDANVGDTITINGVKYKKTGTDSYEPQ